MKMTKEKLAAELVKVAKELLADDIHLEKTYLEEGNKYTVELQVSKATNNTSYGMFTGALQKLRLKISEEVTLLKKLCHGYSFELKESNDLNIYHDNKDVYLYTSLAIPVNGKADTSVLTDMLKRVGYNQD